MHSQPKQPADQSVRDECIAVDQSFVVTAPAGSGKTSLLTQRTLSLLATVEHPEAVLCITFTRKAAAEMRQRIISALDYAAKHSCPEDPNGAKTWHLAHAVLRRDSELDWQILNNPARLKITTIDGFCRSITNQLPLAAGIGVGLANLEIPEQAYRQAARDTIAWLEKPPSVFHKAVKELLLALDGNSQKLEELFYLLLQKRDQWLPLVIPNRDQRELLEDNIRQLVVDELTVCVDLCKSFAGDLLTLANFCADNLLQQGSDSDITSLAKLQGLPDSSPEALPQWQAIANLLLTSSGSLRKKFDKKVGLPAGKTKAEKAAVEPIKLLASEVMQAACASPNLQNQLAVVKRLPPAAYPEHAWQFMQQLTLMLPLLVGHLKTHFSQTNAVDFTEISQAAVAALNPEIVSDILLRLDYQIQHILVDEFQDTSQIQLDLLHSLTAGWQADDGRTLFLVGDGMQSCYGFRGAEVGLFLDVKANGLGEVQPLERSLNTNFRSDSGVVEWVNNTFSQAFPQQDDIARGAVKYNHAIAFNSACDQQAIAPVHCYGLVQDPDQENTNQRQDEAHTVVKIVQQTRAEHPQDSIAILVRGRGHLAEINQALSAAGLVPQATDIEPLAQRQAIIDALALTRALLRPADRLSWFALFRAPWAALTPAEMLVVADAIESNVKTHPLIIDWLIHSDMSELDITPASQQRLLIIQSAFTLAWQERRRYRLRMWLERIWTALHGPAGLISASDLDNMQAFWRLIENYDNSGFITDWEGFQLAIEKLYAAPAAEADGQLHIMTLHKSKGLEFDHVIIPALDKSSRADNKELLNWQTRLAHDGQPLFLMAPMDFNDDKKTPSLYRFLDEEMKLKSRYEAVRLLYVGCTRAIKQLHLLAQVKWDESGDQAKTPASNALMHSIWPTFEQQMQVIHPTVAQFNNLQNRPQVPETWHKIRRTEFDSLAQAAGNSLLAQYRGQEYDDEDNTPDLAGYGNWLARSFGTALHQLLETIGAQGIEDWNDERIQSYLPNIQSWLAQLGISEFKQPAREIVRIGQRMLVSDHARWMLSAEREQAASELELLDTDNDKLYIIDRTFIDQSKRWIIDYKTSKPLPEESIEDFFAREARHYRSQLSNYARLLQALEAEQTVTALYFPLIDRLHMVDTELASD